MSCLNHPSHWGRCNGTLNKQWEEVSAVKLCIWLQYTEGTISQVEHQVKAHTVHQWAENHKKSTHTAWNTYFWRSAWEWKTLHNTAQPLYAFLLCWCICLYLSLLSLFEISCGFCFDWWVIQAFVTQAAPGWHVSINGRQQHFQCYTCLRQSGINNLI